MHNFFILSLYIILKISNVRVFFLPLILFVINFEMFSNRFSIFLLFLTTDFFFPLLGFIIWYKIFSKIFYDCRFKIKFFIFLFLVYNYCKLISSNEVSVTLFKHNEIYFLIFLANKRKKKQ